MSEPSIPEKTIRALHLGNLVYPTIPAHKDILQGSGLLLASGRKLNDGTSTGLDSFHAESLHEQEHHQQNLRPHFTYLHLELIPI